MKKSLLKKIYNLIPSEHNPILCFKKDIDEQLEKDKGGIVKLIRLCNGKIDLLTFFIQKDENDNFIPYDKFTTDVNKYPHFGYIKELFHITDEFEKEINKIDFKNTEIDLHGWSNRQFFKLPNVKYNSLKELYDDNFNKAFVSISLEDLEDFLDNSPCSEVDVIRIEPSLNAVTEKMTCHIFYGKGFYCIGNINVEDFNKTYDDFHNLKITLNFKDGYKFIGKDDNEIEFIDYITSPI